MPEKPSKKPTSNQPAHEIRINGIRATIWRNDTDKGPRFNTTFDRSYLAMLTAKTIQHRRNLTVLLAIVAALWGAVYLVRSEQLQRAKTNTASAMAPEVKATDKQQQQGVLNNAPSMDDKVAAARERAIREAALLAQRQQERRTAVEEMRKMVNAQDERLKQIARNCGRRMYANSNSIAEVRTSYRKELHSKNNRVWIDARGYLQKHTDYLAGAWESLKTAETRPELELKISPEQLNASFASMNTEWASITNELNEVETEISNAPAKFHFFK